MRTPPTIACALVATLAIVSLARDASAQSSGPLSPPLLHNPGQLPERPDLSGLPRLRFLTSLDFPPFNFADAQRKPSGFNVDLARAICETLEIVAKCEVQALPWDELLQALEARRGEAVIAGHVPNADLRARFGLTSHYLHLPFRFVARNGDGPQPDALADWLPDRRVAVVANTVPARFLQTHFPQVRVEPVANDQDARTALQDGTVDAIFADGVTLSFWLTSPVSQDCCRFAGGAYFDHGPQTKMVIVTRIADRALRQALEHGLVSVEQTGRMHDIFRRFLPLDPYL